MKIVIIDPYTVFSRYSLFCGVFCLLMPFIDYPNGIFSGFILGVTAVTLSVISCKDKKKHTCAKIGRIAGILGTLLCIVLFYSFYSFYSFVSSPEVSGQVISFLSEFLAGYGLSLDSFISSIRIR